MKEGHIYFRGKVVPEILKKHAVVKDKGTYWDIYTTQSWDYHHTNEIEELEENGDYIRYLLTNGSEEIEFSVYPNQIVINRTILLTEVKYS